MKIAIGSLRQPKINAVKRAFSRVRQTYHLLEQPLEYIPLSAESGISEMPLSLGELLLGSFNRAQFLISHFQARPSKPDFYVGPEGGFFLQSGPGTELTYFLQSWVYISDGEAGFYGASCAVPVPAKIAAEVADEGKELGKIIDTYGREMNIRDKQGAFGVFTAGLVDRETIFEQAVINALSPFFNAPLYKTN